jgi:hypothetical protein
MICGVGRGRQVEEEEKEGNYLTMDPPFSQVSR